MRHSPHIVVTAKLSTPLSEPLEQSGVSIAGIPIGRLIRSRSKKGVVIRLPRMEPSGSEDGTTSCFRLIGEIRSAELRINCAEYRRHDTFASVVCGLSGKRLSPYWKKTKSASPLPVDAWFSATDGLITVSYDSRTDRIRIVKRSLHRHEADPLLVYVRKDVLFEDRIDLLSENLRRYRDAAETAVDKVTESAPNLGRIRFIANDPKTRQ